MRPIYLQYFTQFLNNNLIKLLIAFVRGRKNQITTDENINIFIGKLFDLLVYVFNKALKDKAFVFGL